MKPLAKLLLALTAVAAFSFAQSARANLITNPGFETGDLTGWTAAATVFVDNVSAHSGNFGADMQIANASNISQSVATTPGATYTISFFAASFVPLQPINLSVTFGGTVFSHLFPVGQTGYTEFTFNATASGANTNLLFQVGVGPTTFFLDDISVEPTGVGVPDGGTTASLFGCALVGLAALRRRLGC